MVSPRFSSPTVWGIAWMHRSSLQTSFIAGCIVDTVGLTGVLLTGQGKSTTSVVLQWRQSRKKEEVVQGKGQGQGPARCHPRQGHV
ncbi:hypothetical protein CPB85DRAFT_1416534 [Mucidula mucida]|nr:hypothetical protein CPB85DRAFT_1416534 [Mucidula mucida]